MSSVVTEIKKYPPADRLRMILMILGNRNGSPDCEELLTIGFDSIRTLEHISTQINESMYDNESDYSEYDCECDHCVNWGIKSYVDNLRENKELTYPPSQNILHPVDWWTTIPTEHPIPSEHPKENIPTEQNIQNESL